MLFRYDDYENNMYNIIRATNICATNIKSTNL